MSTGLLHSYGPMSYGPNSTGSIAWILSMEIGNVIKVPYNCSDKELIEGFVEFPIHSGLSLCITVYVQDKNTVIWKDSYH